MKLLLSLLMIQLAFVCEASNFATSDTGSDCLSGWTKVNGQTHCNPPTELTDSITCSSTGISLTIKPSHVFENHILIPADILSTMKVQIAGSQSTYEDFITFGTDNTGKTAGKTWKNLGPEIHSTSNKLFMSYKLKVDEPIITYGSSTVKLQTTQSVNEFYVTCVIDRQVEVTTSALSMDILNFGAATNGTATNQIDTSGIFSIKTYSDNTYGTESDTYTIGNTVFAKIKADNMAQMPSIIGWEVNECKATGDDGADTMPIFKSAGACLNPYLGVSSSPAEATQRKFNFKAFTFDDTTTDDSIEIKCSIKLGKTGSDTYSNSADACQPPMVS